MFISLLIVQAAASAFATAYPVHAAAARCDVDELRRIISRGADVNKALEQVRILDIPMNFIRMNRE
jgi:hypothetical protein